MMYKLINRFYISKAMSDPEEVCICDHQVSHKDDKIWVRPSPAEKKHTPHQPRLYCKVCGRLKYNGSANAKDLGFYINVLKELKQKVDVLYKRKAIGHRLTQAQIRLIIKELGEDEDFLDGFSNQKYSQYEFFKSTIKKHCMIDDYIIDGVHEQFKP